MYSIKRLITCNLSLMNLWVLLVKRQRLRQGVLIIDAILIDSVVTILNTINSSV